MNQKMISIMERLNKHPRVLEIFEEMLSAMENESGEFDIADDMEEKLIKESRGLNKAVLSAWAELQEEKLAKQIKITTAGTVKHHSKKN